MSYGFGFGVVVDFLGDFLSRTFFCNVKVEDPVARLPKM
jgi:hypothetical protein